MKLKFGGRDDVVEVEEEEEEEPRINVSALILWAGEGEVQLMATFTREWLVMGCI